MTRSRPGPRSSRTRRSARDYKQDARPRRLRARELGRGQRDHRRRQRLHRSRPTAPTASSASRRSRRCRWSATPRARATCRCSAASACVLRLVLRPAAVVSPQTWGEQTDVPESADWYNSGFLIALGLERAADAHAGRALLHRGALQGHQEVVDLARTIRKSPSSPTSGCSPKQGTDAALAMAMGHVILNEFYLDRQAQYFDDYARQLHRHADAGAAGEAGRPARCRTGCVRASDFDDNLGEANNPEWKTVAYRRDLGEHRRAARLGRLPLGREGQVEPRGEGGRAAARPSCSCRFAGDQGRDRRRSPSRTSATS